MAATFAWTSTNPEFLRALYPGDALGKCGSGLGNRLTGLPLQDAGYERIKEMPCDVTRRRHCIVASWSRGRLLSGTTPGCLPPGPWHSPCSTPSCLRCRSE